MSIIAINAGILIHQWRKISKGQRWIIIVGTKTLMTTIYAVGLLAEAVKHPGGVQNWVTHLSPTLSRPGSWPGLERFFCYKEKFKVSQKYKKKIINTHYNEQDYNITIEIINGAEVPFSLIKVIRQSITQANFDLETERRKTLTKSR